VKRSREGNGSLERGGARAALRTADLTSPGVELIVECREIADP